MERPGPEASWLRSRALQRQRLGHCRCELVWTFTHTWWKELISVYGTLHPDPRMICVHQSSHMV